MIIRRRGKNLKACGVLLLAGAFISQFGLSCTDYIEIFNPCGTVFSFCTQEDLQFLLNPVPDYENDPSCTIPGACGDGPFPPGPGPRPGGGPP